MTATASPERTGPDLPDTDATASRRGDRAFAALVRLAAFTILVALVAVFVFLAIEGWSGFTDVPATYAPFTSFVTLHQAAGGQHAAGLGDRA